MSSMKSLFAALLLSATALAPAMAASQGRATAVIVDAQGQTRGNALLLQRGDAIHVTVQGVGLPAGVHAVHLHMTGTCTGPDFKSAGGHWNPSGRQHGRDNSMGAHMGDLPNMTVAADGTGTLDVVVAHAMLSGGPSPLLDADGAAVVIHADPDDYKTDPTGNAGGRLACGVIQPANAHP